MTSSYQTIDKAELTKSSSINPDILLKFSLLSPMFYHKKNCSNAGMITKRAPKNLTI